MKSMTLYYNDLQVGGKSDKEYRIQIEHFKKGQWNPAPDKAGYVVLFQFGRRGGTLQAGHKCDPVALEEAQAIFDRLVAEKIGKGYVRASFEAPGQTPKGHTAAAPANVPADAGRTKYPAELLDEVSTDDALRYIANSDYWMQVKVDGHRRQIEKHLDGAVISYNKLGKAVGLPLEVEHELKLIPLESFFMDGELIGNSYVAYDLLAADGLIMSHYTYSDRFNHLVGALAYRGANFITAVTTWRTTAEKRGGYQICQANRCEGVVFKSVQAVYRGGESGQHKKLKFTKTASCKVIAVGIDSKANAAVALFDGKKWVEVAHVSTIGKGKIAVGDVVEVEFLCATEGRRLREPRIKEVRNDEVGASECTIDQLKNAYKEGVAA